MKQAIKYIVKSIIIGIAGVLIINLIGQFFNFNIPFNIFSVLLLGFFRLPGLIVLLIFLIL